MKQNSKSDDELWNSLLDDEQGFFSRVFLNRKFWSFFLLIVAGFSVGYIVWAGIYGDEVESRDIPYLKAENKPYKVAAIDNRVDILHTESTVFETLGDESSGVNQNIVVVKEEKIDRESLFAGLKTEIKTSDTKPKNLDVKKLEIKKNIQASVIIRKPVPRPEKKFVKKEVTKKAIVQKRVVKESSGNWYVQLGSVKSAGIAKKEWDRLKNVYASSLSGTRFSVQKAEIANKGTFYRIRAGGMTKSKARDICSKIKAKKPGACIVVKN